MIDLVQKMNHVVARANIQPRRRFVEQNQLRIADQGAANKHRLLLAAGHAGLFALVGVITPHNAAAVMVPVLLLQGAGLGMVMAPLADQKVPLVVIDLSSVGYFGSVFLALLLRCHKFVKSRGGELVLAGASPMARELLRITALDTLWAIYDDRDSALEAVGA